MNFTSRIAAGLAIAAAALSAQAAVTVTAGNSGSFDANVIRNGCGLSGSSTGTTVTGCLNTDHSSLVTFTSDESLTIADSGGQARVSSFIENNPVSFITIASGTSLSTMILNISATANGYVQFSIGGTPVPGSTDYFAISKNGSNFFTISGSPSFSNLTFTSFTKAGSVYTETDLISDVAQVRLGTVSAVPEPETVAMMLAGLGIVGFVSRRRRTN